MLIEITYNVTDVYMSTTETPVYVEISFEQPGGTSAVWGSITGTLSNQTDLQTALDLKLDESTIDGGAEGQILSKASATDFDFAWINNYAKYLATNVRNQTGSTIAAFRVVYISGATGNKPLVSLADADTEATSSKTYGVTAISIANNGTGDVVTAGELSGIDTSAFNEGDSLWLSSTAGQVQTTPPAEPAHTVFIGTVVRSHPTLGVIDVAIQNAYELTELHGVEITSAANNDGLFYNGSLWVNKSIATVLGYTPEQPLTFSSPLSRVGNVVNIPQATGSVNGFLSSTDWTTFNSKQAALGYTPANAATTLTINGVTYDLSANRSWTISAGISGSGASGQVTYWTGASAVGGSSNFTWDGNNINLSSNKGIILQRTGTNRNISIVSADIVDNFTGATFYPQTGINVATSLSIVPRGTGLNEKIKSQITIFNTDYVADANNYELAVFRAGGTNYSLSTGKNGTATIKPLLLSAGFATDAITNGNQLWLYTTGNVGINTTTDNGARLQVSGNVTIQGGGNTSATNALAITNSSSTALLTVRNDGYSSINYAGTSAAANAGLEIISTSATATAMSSLSINGNSSTGHKFLISHIGADSSAYLQNYSTSSGNYRGIFFLGNAITFEVTNTNYAARVQALSVNANGYVGINNTSPTALTDIGASTTTRASLRIRSGTAPTSPNDGDIWFDGTDIKMRIGGVTKTFTLV